MLGIAHLAPRSLAIAAAAFCGLALMPDARPGAVQPIGLIAAFGAAIARVISLLVTRARLGGTEARLTTWYSLLAAAIVFVAASLLNRSFSPPLTDAGWLAFPGIGVTTTLSALCVYVSTARVGALRTALVMNLEPVVSGMVSVALSGEMVTGLQGLGATVMVVSPGMFRLRR